MWNDEAHRMRWMLEPFFERMGDHHEVARFVCTFLNFVAKQLFDYDGLLLHERLGLFIKYNGTLKCVVESLVLAATNTQIGPVHGGRPSFRKRFPTSIASGVLRRFHTIVFPFAAAFALVVGAAAALAAAKNIFHVCELSLPTTVCGGVLTTGALEQLFILTYPLALALAALGRFRP